MSGVRLSVIIFYGVNYVSLAREIGCRDKWGLREWIIFFSSSFSNIEYLFILRILDQALIGARLSSV